jgi:hypothetical protein
MIEYIHRQNNSFIHFIEVPWFLLANRPLDVEHVRLHKYMHKNSELTKKTYTYIKKTADLTKNYSRHLKFVHKMSMILYNKTNMLY